MEMDRTEYEKKLIKNIITSIEEHGGKDILSSVILTGSFGRGEPTYDIGESGELGLKSDVEIALIYPKSSKKGNVEKLIKEVLLDFREDLNLMPISEQRVRKVYNFNFSFRVPKYKTIFTYDLFNGSKTIWGRDFIGEKSISLMEVDQYEAKRLVSNRIGELIYLQNSSMDRSSDYLRMQWKGKLMLAIVSAWLICEGEYVSSYHEQFGKIRASRERTEKVLGNGFAQECEKVFSFLRENGSAYEVPDAILFEFVKNIDRYFCNIGLKKPKVNSCSRKLKYFIKYVKAGMKFGLIGFEDNILQTLITSYWKKLDELRYVAEVWHKVLY